MKRQPTKNMASWISSSGGPGGRFCPVLIFFLSSFLLAFSSQAYAAVMAFPSEGSSVMEVATKDIWNAGERNTPEVNANSSAGGTLVYKPEAESSATSYRYLRLTALGGVSTYEVYVTEINWLAGAEVHPKVRTTSGSGNVSTTAGGSSAWRAYDGLAELPSWNSQTTTFPYSITIDLGAGGAINPTGIQIAAQWQERTMSSFKCEGSNDGTTWTTLFSESGLTSSDWVRDAFKTFEFPARPENLLSNGEFDNGSNGWTSIFQGNAAGGGSFSVVTNAGMSGANAGKLSITNGGTANWNVELFSPFNMESGKTYEVTFQAKSAAARPALLLFQKGSDPFTHYWEQSLNLTTTAQEFGPYTWTADVSDAATRLNFKVGNSNADIWIDSVVVREVPSVDTEVPSSPSGLSASAVGEDSFTLSWNASSDNRGVTSYEVFAGSESKGTTTSTSINVTGLDCNASYAMTVRATDAAGNVSAASSPLSVSTSACPVINLLSNGEFYNGSNGWTAIFQGNAAGGGSFSVVTNAGMSGANAGKLSITNGGTANWNVELFSPFNMESGKTYEVTFQAKAAAARPALLLFQNGSDPFTHYWEQSLNLTTTAQEFGPYTWTADVNDAATRLNFKVGNSNADIWIDAVVVREVLPSGDTQAPTAPANLTSGGVSQDSFTLSWDASTDNTGVASYEVFAGSVSKGTTTSTSMDITGLSCNTTYSMTVIAKDAAGNVSAASSAKSVVTSGCTVTNYPNENSMLGMNLSGPRPWSKEHYFTNLAHHSLDWMPLGSAPGFSNRIPRSELTRDRYLKPGESGRLCVIWDLSTDYLTTGDYVFTYEGTADVSFSEYSTSGITLVSSGDKRIVINIPPLSSQVFLYFDVANNSSSDPVRNIRFMELDRENSTDTFRPEFVNDYKTLKAYRFMDWMRTNNSTVSAWEDYPADNALLQTEGVSFNFMIALANQTNSDAWFCVPMLADDNFVRQMAVKIRNDLKPELRAYIELSNEVWNGQFLADNQAAAKAVEVGISGNDEKPWEDAARYLGYRTAQIEQMFKEEFSKVSVKPELTTLIAWQSANVWPLENRALPQYKNIMGASAVPEAVAIAPYFGGSLGSASNQSIVETWTVDMVFDQLMNNTYGDQVGDVTIERSIGFMRNYKAFTDEYNIPKLLAYEGGQHLVGTGSAYENVTLRNLFIAANRDRKMFDAYISYFDAWKEIGGDLFATFASTASFGKSGSWGWKESPSETREEAPKYDATLTWNDNNRLNSGSATFMRVSEKGGKLNSLEKSILIYPNPAENGSVTIKFDKPSQNTLKIHNMNGKVYVNETVNEEVKTFDLESFKSGMYFFQINGVSQKVIIP